MTINITNDASRSVNNRSRIVLENARVVLSMEQHTLKNVNNNLNASIYSYLETSGGIEIRLECVCFNVLILFLFLI